MPRLSSAITAVDTTIPLGPDYIHRADFPQSGVVLIDTEEIHYSNTTDRELIGCTRGFNGTSAATHAKDSSLTVVFTDTSSATVEAGQITFSNGTTITVSGDTVVFTNADASKSFTITMV